MCKSIFSSPRAALFTLLLALAPLSTQASSHNSMCSPERIQEALDAGWDPKVIQTICPPPKPEPSPSAFPSASGTGARPCTDRDRARMILSDLGTDAISDACGEKFNFRKSCTDYDRAQMVLVGISNETIAEVCGTAPAPVMPAPAPRVQPATPPSPAPAAEPPAPREAEPLEPLDLEPASAPEPEPEPELVEMREEIPEIPEEAQIEEIEELEMEPMTVVEMEHYPMTYSDLWRFGLGYGSQQGTYSNAASQTLSDPGALSLYGMLQMESGFTLGGRLRSFKMQGESGSVGEEFLGGLGSAGWLWRLGDLSLGAQGVMGFGRATLQSSDFESTSTSLMVYGAEALALYDLDAFHLGLSFGQHFGDVKVAYAGASSGSATYALGSSWELLLGMNF